MQALNLFSRVNILSFNMYSALFVEAHFQLAGRINIFMFYSIVKGLMVTFGILINGFPFTGSVINGFSYSG